MIIERIEKIAKLLPLIYGASSDVVTPFELALRVVQETVSTEHYLDADRKVLDPCCGRGTFLLAYVYEGMKVLEKKIPDEQARVEYLLSKLVGRDINPAMVDTCKSTMYNIIGRKVKNINIKVENTLNWNTNMKFDCVIGNPPYNEAAASEKTIAGTSGDTTLYKRFIDKAFSLRKEGGVVSFVVQRNGIKHAAKNFNVSAYDNDTSDYWKYTAGIFRSVDDNNDCVDETKDSVLLRCYNIFEERPFTHAMGGSYKKLLAKGAIFDKQVPNSVYGLVECPKDGEKEIYGYIPLKKKKSRRVGNEAKLVFKGLESKNSYFVTDLPVHVGSACVLYFDSIAEAEQARLFILNNPVIKYMQRKLKEKALGLVFRYVKSFDLSQIVTGAEIPREFMFSKEEIDYIKETVK